MLTLLVDTGPLSDTLVADPRDYGAATADHRDQPAPPSAWRRTLATVTTALAATRRAFGD